MSYSPHALAFKPAGINHRDDTAAGTRFFVIEIPENWERRLGEFSSSLKTLSPGFCGADGPWLAMTLYDVIKHSPACSSLLVEGIVFDLLAGLAGQRSLERRKPQWLGRVMDLIHAEFAEDLKLETLAAQAGVHPAYLSRVFRTIHRESPGHYVNRLRIRYASAQLTKRTDLPLSGVAVDVGFADQSHFTRVFKQITGVTPGAFRSAAANAESR